MGSVYGYTWRKRHWSPQALRAGRHVYICVLGVDTCALVNLGFEPAPKRRRGLAREPPSERIRLTVLEKNSFSVYVSFLVGRFY